MAAAAADEADDAAADHGAARPTNADDEEACSRAPAAAAATGPPSLLMRLLQHARSVSIRNLAAAPGLLASSPARAQEAPLPSTYLQVLLPAADGEWEVVWTSGVAEETLNATWLLLDLGAALRKRRRRRRRRAAGAAATEEEETMEEARIRVFMLLHGDQEEQEEGGLRASGDGEEPPLELVPSIPTVTSIGGSVGKSKPHLQQQQQQQHRSRSPSHLLAEFSLRASALWSLPPSLPLSRLPLPPDRACCLLATREGGEGLVVPQELYEALATEVDGRNGTPTHGKRRESSSAAAAAAAAGWLTGLRRVGEEFVAALVEDGPSSSSDQDEEEEEEEAEGGCVRTALASLDVGENQGPQEGARRRARRALAAAEEEVVRLRAAVEAAEARLRGEEGLLREERLSLAREAEGVEGLMAAWVALDAEGVAVREAVAGEEEECRRLTLLLQAREAKLLQELQRIYPIRHVRSASSHSHTSYSIRGVELPLDPSTVGSSREEEEAAASALGYLAHLITLLSKLWGVPLRYALSCRASRSLVRDAAAPTFPFLAHHPAAVSALASAGGSSSGGGGDPSSSSTEASEALQAAATTFPLFRRGVERERFDWAVNLLRRDVVQLLAARNLPAHKVAVVDTGSGPRWHLLQAVQALMAHELRMWPFPSSLSSS